MTASRMPVIDVHMHVGAYEPQDWMPGMLPVSNRGQSPRDMLRCMDAAGVDMAVMHTCDVWGMRYAARMLREHGERFIGVCKVDGGTAHLRTALDAIPRHVDEEGFRGLYFDPWPPALDAFRNFHAPTYRPLWDLVQALRLPVCVVSYGTDSPDLFAGLVGLLDRYPDLTVTVVHGLYVGRKTPPGLIDADGRVHVEPSIVELVRDCDVYLEILAGYPGAWFGPDDAVLQCLYNTFGPRKLLWGSEFTKANALSQEQARSPTFYARQVGYLRDHCPYIPAADRAWILGGNAARIYGAGPLPADE